VVHLSSHPLISWLSFQLPLRGEALLLAAFFLANLLPLVAFYDLYMENNVL
jgi:hypothetical protein